MNLGDTNIRPITPAIEIMIYLSPTQMSKALGPLSRDVTIPCLLLSNDEPVSSPPGLFLSQMGAPSGRCACITSGFTPAPKEAPGVPLVSGSNSLAHLHQPGSAQCTSLNAPPQPCSVTSSSYDVLSPVMHPLATEAWSF